MNTKLSPDLLVKKTAAIFGLTIFLLSSCTVPAGNANSKPPASGSQIDANIASPGASISEQEVILEIDIAQNGRDITQYFDLSVPWVSLIFSGDVLLQDTSDENSEKTIHRKDLTTNPEDELSAVHVKGTNWVSTVDSVVMGERYLYFTQTVDAAVDYTVSDRQLIEVDTEMGTYSVIDSRLITDEDRPFVYLSKYDAARYLSCEINAEESILKLHNSTDGSLVELVNHPHERINGVIYGEILMDVAASNGRIFVLVCSCGQETLYYLNEYNESGHLINTYESAALDTMLHQSPPVGIYMLGDYLFLRTWDGDHALFELELEKGTLTQCYIPIVGSMLMFSLANCDNYYTDKDNHYIYFEADREKYNDNLYVFDTQRGEWLTVHLPLGDTGKVIYLTQCDESGNLILTYVKYDPDPKSSSQISDFSYYYLPHSELAGFLDEQCRTQNMR